MENKSEYKKIISQLTPSHKLELAQALYFNAFELKKAAIKSQNPQISEEELLNKTKEIFKNARS